MNEMVCGWVEYFIIMVGNVAQCCTNAMEKKCLGFVTKRDIRVWFWSLPIWTQKKHEGLNSGKRKTEILKCAQ